MSESEASADARDGRGPARGAPIQAFFAGRPQKPTIARAEGLYMWDDSGRRYIDVSSGPVVSNLGHCNPRVIAAMAEQARRTGFACPSAFVSEANLTLAERVAGLAGPGLERLFPVSGGSEAVESCIKFARQVALTRGEPSRCKVISRMPSYHGGTLGALALTGDTVAEEVFGPMMRSMPKIPAPLSYRFPAGHDGESYAAFAAEALKDEIERQGPETVLAFIYEPVGGLATGALVAPDFYYLRVREICDTYGVLMICDEVMSGAGRTGAFLASDHWPGARPDIVALAKGIGAGYTPLGMMLASAEMVDAVVESGGFLHGHTYNANPMTCAIGAAVLDEVIERGLIANAREKGAELRRRLNALCEASPIVGDVRGRGLLQAIEIVADKDSKAMIPLELQAPTRIGALARERGLVLYTRRTSGGKYGDWLMITPALIVDSAQIDEIVGRLAETLQAYADELRAAGVV